MQAWLFNPNKLAPTYPESAITRPFPFNAYYPEDEAPEVDGADYQLEVGGLVDNKKPWTLERALRAAAGDADHAPHLRRGLERDRQVDRACGSPNSCAGSAPTPRAKYVWFQCAEGYSNTIDMATALHPQTQMTFKFDDEILPRKYGFPMKVPHADQARLQESEARDRRCTSPTTDLGGYWEDQGYNWFSGL